MFLIFFCKILISLVWCYKIGDNRAVTVYNVPEYTIDQTLKQYFSTAGTFDCTFIDADESVGFVVYRDSQNAIDAANSLHGQIITGQTLSMNISVFHRFDRTEVSAQFLHSTKTRMTLYIMAPHL